MATAGAAGTGASQKQAVESRHGGSTPNFQYPDQAVAMCVIAEEKAAYCSPQLSDLLSVDLSSASPFLTMQYGSKISFWQSDGSECPARAATVHRRSGCAIAFPFGATGTSHNLLAATKSRNAAVDGACDSLRH